MRISILVVLISLCSQPSVANEYHVSVKGSDDGNGSATSPLKTISAAAKVAMPGDVITVHEGTYRERVNPPRGGTSDTERITYRAARGETVVLKGSEIIKGWQKEKNGVWKITLPNSFFKQYNPYKDVIKGDWFRDKGRVHHTGEVYLDGAALYEVVSLDKISEGNRKNWYCQSDDKNTHIWANFEGADPNKALVEINVRPTCFYSDTPGRDYITVSGFTMRHAATQWAAPTAEQIALIGTHWSKGWIIENNIISDSKCVGVTLGKDRASGHNMAESADGYNVVVKRALESSGWSKENIGSHKVRNNTIYECGAAGICGSLGAVFSEITGNHIYNIHLNKPYTGAEMAGIKLHAAIDTLIRNNYIHHTCRGIWLDWMAQGTQVSQNLLHDNGSEDLFVEVNHGPFVVDNNIFLSPKTLLDCSQGGAFLHNLFTGYITRHPQDRHTPYHKEHSVQIAGLHDIPGGDNRFYNNIFAGGKGLQIYDDAKLPIFDVGNVFLNGTAPCKNAKDSVVLSKFNPDIKVVAEKGTVDLHISLPPMPADAKTRIVTTKLLGKAKIPGLAYISFDGAPLAINTDYFGKPRNPEQPSPGPFENLGKGKLNIQVWPVKR
ncbi:MAG: right-handed parallel beta-helix repeat-containing protein [Pirellulales bacterium]|nr:right-handed parallel beta-helix repeat-containing protein [Pirellulales bacterium]